MKTLNLGAGNAPMAYLLAFFCLSAVPRQKVGYRMAIGTKKQKVVAGIVSALSINVMHLKDFYLSIISAVFAMTDVLFHIGSPPGDGCAAKVGSILSVVRIGWPGYKRLAIGMIKHFGNRLCFMVLFPKRIVFLVIRTTCPRAVADNKPLALNLFYSARKNIERAMAGFAFYPFACGGRGLWCKLDFIVAFYHVFLLCHILYADD